MFRRKRLLLRVLDGDGEEVDEQGRDEGGGGAGGGKRTTTTESSSGWRQQLDARPSRRLHRPQKHNPKYLRYIRYFLGLLLLQASAIVILYSLLADSVLTRRSLREGGIDENRIGRYEDDDSTGDNTDNNNVQAVWRNSNNKNINDNDVNSEKTQPPLDNYYSRRHIPQLQQSQQPLLIVGGSDGSGTRVVVDLLGRLGVLMLVDDTGTYDVDAKAIHYQGAVGWPPLVQTVLEWTASVNYEVQDIPKYVVDEILDQIDAFRETYQVRADHLLADLQESGRGPSVATKISYGFKAPVSMLLLPIFQQVYSNIDNNSNDKDNGIKFLHVIRDGRDVALSANQSPVEKFYDSYYTDAPARRYLYDKPNDEDAELKFLMAMQLWNDWNVQVHEWCQRHNDGDTFDYLVLRSEDLLPHPHQQQQQSRYESLLQLAHFVGSPRTERELCCLARQELLDMGKSDGTTTAKKKAIVPMADLDTLVDHGRSSGPGGGGGGGLFDSNLEILHQSWQEATMNTSKVNNPMEEAQKQLEKLQQKRLQELTTTAAATNNLEKSQVRGRLQKQAGFSQLLGRSGGGEDDDDDDYDYHYAEKLGASDDFREEEEYDSGVFMHKEEGADAAGGDLEVNSENEPATTTGGSDPGPDDIMQRYGKWEERLKNRPDVVALFHSEGSEALATFGYHPRASFQDRAPISSTSTSTDFRCDATVTCDDYL